jgi:hypothetical protein
LKQGTDRDLAGTDPCRLESTTLSGGEFEPRDETFLSTFCTRGAEGFTDRAAVAAAVEIEPTIELRARHVPIATARPRP